MYVADYYFSLLVTRTNIITPQLHCIVQKKSKTPIEKGQKFSQIFGQNSAVLMPPEPF